MEVVMKKIFAVMTILLISVFLFSACAQVTTTIIEDVSGSDEKKSEDKSYVFEKDDEDSPSTESAKNADTVFSDYTYLGYIYYGKYPQSLAKRDAYKFGKMSKIKYGNTNYYLSDYDKELYAKVRASAYGKGYKFSDDRDIEDGAEYYFKVEPIRWNVYGKADLQSGKVQLFLLCNLIIDSKAFLSDDSYERNMVDGEYYNKKTGALANSWASSDVRSWLNDSFVKTAFTEKELSNIIPRKTSDVSDVYDENDNEEYAYLMTYQQAVAIKNPVAQVSDYARVRSTFIAIDDAIFGNGRYWLCSNGNKSYQAAYVSNYNNIVSQVGESVGAAYMGVRPAITISADSTIEILTKEDKKK